MGGDLAGGVALHIMQKQHHPEFLRQTHQSLQHRPIPGLGAPARHLLQPGVGMAQPKPPQISAAVGRHPDQPGLFVLPAGKRRSLLQIAQQGVLHRVLRVRPAAQRHQTQPVEHVAVLLHHPLRFAGRRGKSLHDSHSLL